MALPLIDAIARAFAPGPPIRFASLGSSILKVGLHPPPTACVRRSPRIAACRG
jgi:hypothetical protein